MSMVAQILRHAGSGVSIRYLHCRTLPAYGYSRLCQRRKAQAVTKIGCAQSSSTAAAEMSQEVRGDAPTLSSIVHGSLSENPWGQASKRVRFPKLQKDLDTDVCVVGGGVAGLTVALNLLRSGNSLCLRRERG